MKEKGELIEETLKEEERELEDELPPLLDKSESKVSNKIRNSEEEKDKLLTTKKYTVYDKTQFDKYTNQKYTPTLEVEFSPIEPLSNLRKKLDKLTFYTENSFYIEVNGKKLSNVEEQKTLEELNLNQTSIQFTISRKETSKVCVFIYLFIKIK